MTRTIFLSTAAIIALSLASCNLGGPRLHKVSGEVTFDGNPVPSGDIVFTLADGSHGSDAGKIENGRFEVQVKEGSHKVHISATKKKTLPEGETGAMGEKEVDVEYIPDQYNANTTLTATVPSAEPLKFVLKSE